MKPKLPLSRLPPKPTLAFPLNAAKTEPTARIATRRIAIVFFIIPLRKIQIWFTFVLVFKDENLKVSHIADTYYSLYPEFFDSNDVYILELL